MLLKLASLEYAGGGIWLLSILGKTAGFETVGLLLMVRSASTEEMVGWLLMVVLPMLEMKVG